jgi:hypothetical protein
VHDETIFTTCERCDRGFNLSNPEVKLEPPSAYCPHCGQKTAVDQTALERAIKYRTGIRR